jgi:hypothetical protein
MQQLWLLSDITITSSSGQAGFGQPQNGQWPRKQLTDMHSLTSPELN